MSGLSIPKRYFVGYIIDLDGVVCLGAVLLPTVGETLTALRRRSCAKVLISSNPTHSRSEHADKLTRLGVPTPVEDILTFSRMRQASCRAACRAPAHSSSERNPYAPSCAPPGWTWPRRLSVSTL